MTKQECYEVEARNQYLLDSYWMLEEAAVRKTENDSDYQDETCDEE